MASSPQAPGRHPAVIRLLLFLLRLLASLKLAVILLVILAGVLIAATFVEAAKTPEFILWFVYRHEWFVALWGLLGVNVLAAMLIRLPWKGRHVGFLVAHFGVLVLLAGALISWRYGIEGRVSFMEGETVDSISIADRSQITVEQGQPPERSTHLAFYGGPVDWGAGRTLDFGTSGGLGVKVLKFYRHARRNSGWIAAESGDGSPALKLDLTGPDGKSLAQGWLPTDQFRTTLSAGPISCRLLRAPVASMVEDFRRPPADEAAKDGILSMYYADKVYRIPVHEKVGQKVPVGDSGIEVEIVEYLPNARPGRNARFVSEGDEPKNPLVELLVHIPGEEEPVRELAFAPMPFLSLDGVHERRCPVRFWFHHPAVSSPDGAEFLHTPDGKLYCRIVVGDKHQWRGEVKQGDQFEVAGGLEVSVLEYLPHARQDTGFEPVRRAGGEDPPTEEAAALVEVSLAGEQPREIWLQRSDRRHELEPPVFQRIQTAKGPVAVSFGYEYLPLRYSLKLLDFKRGMNPGRRGNASFASRVQLIDPAQGIDQQLEISMNEPLDHGKFSFYQSSFGGVPGGPEASFLSAAYDPGRILKYSGSLLICVGAFVMFYLRGLFVGKPPAAAGRTAGKSRSQSKSSRRPSANPGSGPATDRPTGTGHGRSG
jgi:hypothetical protein